MELFGRAVSQRYVGQYPDGPRRAVNVRSDWVQRQTSSGGRCRGISLIRLRTLHWARRRGEARQPSAPDGHTGPTRQMLPRCAPFRLPHLQAWPCTALTNMRSEIGRIDVPPSHPCDPQRPGSIRKGTTAPKRRRAVDSEGLLLMRITPHPDGRVTRDR